MMKLTQWLWAMMASLMVGFAGAAININTATATELDALPGIGAKKAQAIVDYRTEHGPFKSVDDLKNVKGIGVNILEKLRPEATVGDVPAPKSVPIEPKLTKPQVKPVQTK